MPRKIHPSGVSSFVTHVLQVGRNTTNGEAARQNEREKSLRHRFSTVDTPHLPHPPQKGGDHMKLRDWYELVRIQLRREEGQTMTEYGLLLAVIAIVVVAVAVTLGHTIANTFTSVTNQL
jgi:pilus assembly protein Flp/PilA